MIYNEFNFKTNRFKKLKFIFIVSFLIYFLSSSLIYSHDKQKKEDYLIPMGNIIQLEAELKNVYVRNQFEGSPFCFGDCILKINNTEICNHNDFLNAISKINDENNVSVLIKRRNDQFNMNTNKSTLEKINCNKHISGFATLTYIDPTTNDFGAVGHPISMGDSRQIPLKQGCIFNTNDINIDKSYKGHVGSISAQKSNIIGEFKLNTEFGIKGKIAGIDKSKLKSYEIAQLDDIKLGKAQIVLQTNTNDIKKFDIQIIDIQLQRSPKSKTFKIKITDNELLRNTGGIVQGMSGTPIIQGDKIIGAISHAVENDPTLGYGVYIKWMYNQ